MQYIHNGCTTNKVFTEAQKEFYLLHAGKGTPIPCPDCWKYVISFKEKEDKVVTEQSRLVDNEEQCFGCNEDCPHFYDCDRAW